MLMRSKIKACLTAAVLLSVLMAIGMAEITSSVDIIVLKGAIGVNNASVLIDGQYKGATDASGHLLVSDLIVGYHTVNAKYEDNTGKYIGNSGFEVKPGNNTAKVYLEQ